MAQVVLPPVTVSAAAAPTATNGAAPTSANLLRQRSFALRFRTELCRKYETGGVCDYRDKCMFAHGEEELRTQALNEAEGLDSDKAIRAWIRDQRRVKSLQSSLSTSTMETPHPLMDTDSPIKVAAPADKSIMAVEFRFDEYPAHIESILAALLD